MGIKNSVLNFHCSAPTAGDYKCTLGVDLGGFDKSKSAGLFADMKSVNCEDRYKHTVLTHVAGGSSGLHSLAGMWSVRRYPTDSGNGGGLVSSEVSPQSKGGFSRLVLSQGKMFTVEMYLSSFVDYQDGMEGRSA